jgi:FolB domain-containing protein
MSDKVFVKNLVVPCKVGVTKEEKSKKQNIIVDIEVFCDLSHAGATDILSKSLSYSEIQEKVINAAANREYNLLESFAENLASLVLQSSVASRVVVTVKKEKYGKEPIMGIEITRDRHG